MTTREGWIPEYADPTYWSSRTPLWLGMPKFVNLYLDLNDNKLRRFLKAQKGKVLDAGCGDGRFVRYADVGVDFSRGMLRRAKIKTKFLVRASVLHLPFKDGCFDVAFMVDVSLHIEPSQRKRCFQELSRVAVTYYDFLAENRSVFPYVFVSLMNLNFKSRTILPLLALAFILSFYFDRIRKLRIPT